MDVIDMDYVIYVYFFKTAYKCLYISFIYI